MHPHLNCPLCAAAKMFTPPTPTPEPPQESTLPLATLEDVTQALLKTRWAPNSQDRASWLMARFEIRRR
jgi:hypothetical protein